MKGSGWFLKPPPSSFVPFTLTFLSQLSVCLCVCVSRVRAYLTTNQQDIHSQQYSESATSLRPTNRYWLLLATTSSYCLLLVSSCSPDEVEDRYFFTFSIVHFWYCIMYPCLSSYAPPKRYCREKCHYAYKLSTFLRHQEKLRVFFSKCCKCCLDILQPCLQANRSRACRPQ